MEVAVSNRRIALFGALLLGLSVLLLFAHRFFEQEPHPRALAPAGSEGSSAPTRDGAIDALRAELAALRRNQELLAQASALAASRNDATQAAAAIPAKDDADEVVEERGEWRRRWTTSLDADFQTQAVDARWAPRRESELKSSVAPSDYPGTRVLDVRCRTKFCVMHVEHQDLHAMEKFTGSYYRNAAVENEVMLSQSETEDGTRATIYVSRDGQALPRAEPIAPPAGESG
jgi:hypothetical protein